MTEGDFLNQVGQRWLAFSEYSGAQVIHSPGLKMNFEENKTAKSCFSCSLSPLLGFWVVLELY